MAGTGDATSGARAIDSLLIANRGEIACRIIRTAQAMGIHTVAVYSEPDAMALHVALADEAVALGGAAAADSYLNIDKLLEAAATTGAQAVHPGYGFLSENAAFARACAAAGLIFVGPTAEVIAEMGHKVSAKERMASAGVPVLEGMVVAKGAPVESKSGYPVIVKAALGGGGKGMHVVHRPADLEAAVATARREAAGAFGDDTVFIEPFVDRPRHVEVQIFGDHHGTVVHLGERECSVQRRHQKVIEESPSPAVDAQLRERMTAAAVAAARELGYTNAGTVEFVLAQSGEFFFLEVNTRLQVEHPVTELAWRLRDGSPLDLVALQLRVASGEPLPFSQDDVVRAGHAVEARVYAEDPSTGFLPSSGTVRTWDVPQRQDVRVDGAVESGMQVGIHYDPLLAKVIAAAPSRTQAINSLAATLHAARIHGLTTNRDFLVRALRHPAFLAGSYDTDFIAHHLPSGGEEPDPWRDAAHAVAAALAQARVHHLRSPLPTLPQGWRNSRSAPHRVSYDHGGATIDVAYELMRNGRWKVAVGEQEWCVSVFGWPKEAGGAIDLELGSRRLRATVTLDGEHVDVDSALGHTALRRHPRFRAVVGEDLAGGLVAPMPGSVVSVAVEQGQVVSKGDLLLVLEAMKMEHRVTAPHDGTVAQVRVGPGDPVGAADVLVVLDAP